MHYTGQFLRKQATCLGYWNPGSNYLPILFLPLLRLPFLYLCPTFFITSIIIRHLKISFFLSVPLSDVLLLLYDCSIC